MEEIDEDQVIGDKGAGDKRIWEVVDWHCVVVQTKFFVDVKFICDNFLRSSESFSKGPQFKNTIIKIGDCEFVSSCVLLHLLKFDITVFEATYFLLECDGICL